MVGRAIFFLMKKVGEYQTNPCQCGTMPISFISFWEIELPKWKHVMFLARNPWSQCYGRESTTSKARCECALTKAHDDMAYKIVNTRYMYGIGGE